MPAIASAIGGQPGMLITGLSVTKSDTGPAPVGFGLALGMPPNDAQEPTATTASASFTVSFSMSRLVWPALVE